MIHIYMSLIVMAKFSAEAYALFGKTGYTELLHTNPLLLLKFCGAVQDWLPNKSFKPCLS